jgi:MerR family redox-sensitive transcriptional activator SoxR
MGKISSNLLTIGQVAAEAGVRTSSIRYYESVGVLPEPERASGQRRYSRDVLDRLRFIDVAQRAGFSLEEVREILEASEQEQASGQLQALARAKLPDVEALIAQGQAMRAWLLAASDCTCPTVDACALFESRASP